MLTRRVWTVATLALLLTSPPALGWGRDAHFIIAEIAETYLTPEAKAAVAELLKDDPVCDTLHEASVWPDAMRAQGRYPWARPLHFANVAPGSDGFDMQRDCPDGKCVVGAVHRFADVLRDPTADKAKRREAFKFLCHFAGDLHQPLHVSYAKDRGGNDIKVEFFGDRTNLHRVWDTLILRRAKKPWREHAGELRKSITEQQRKLWTDSKPEDWATESYKLAVEYAYQVPRDGVPGEAYFERCLPIVERRLQQAGVRLAAMLNRVFAKAE